MRVGKSFRHHGQRYIYGGTTLHENQRGRLVRLHVLKSDCPDCGNLFVIKTTARALRSRQINRRCQWCKRPGVPVSLRARST